MLRIFSIWMALGCVCVVRADGLDQLLESILNYQKQNPTVLVKSTSVDKDGNQTRSEELWSADRYFGKFWLESPVPLYFETFFDETTGSGMTYLPVSNVLLPEKDLYIDSLKRSTRWGRPVDIELLRKFFDIEVTLLSETNNRCLELKPKEVIGSDGKPLANQIDNVTCIYSKSGKPIESSIKVGESTITSKMEVVTGLSDEFLEKWPDVSKKRLPEPTDESFILAALKEYLLTKRSGNKKQ